MNTTNEGGPVDLANTRTMAITADHPDNPFFCAHCGTGPSKYMLGCCDECSERLAAEFDDEVNESGYEWWNTGRDGEPWREKE